MVRRRFSLAEGAVLLLIATLLASILVLVDQKRRASDLLLERTLQSARTLANFSILAQEQYAESAESALQTVSLEPQVLAEGRSGGLDLPATYSRHLTERFSRNHLEAEFRIYSNDPFPVSKERRLDDFAQSALAIFERSERPTEYWQRSTGPDGTLRIRLAVPIIMKQECLACHNAPEWGLSNQIWQVGDVRGARDVSVPLPDLNLQGQFQYYTLWALISVSCGMGIFLVLPAVRREVADRAHFEGLSVRMGAQANRFKAEAMTDPLTGLGNRRRFETALSAEMALADSSGAALSVMLFDIDYFKSVNDTYGHDVGDAVIAGVGQTLQNLVRSIDVVARIGGEEFAIILPELHDVAPTDRADTLRRAVGAMQFETGGQRVQVTISGGVSTFQQGDTMADLIKRADACLYEAKGAGRDCVFPQKVRFREVQAG